MSPRQANSRRMRGVVVRDKAAKTITVQVTRQYHHPKYGKIVRKNNRFHAHDESDAAHVGDMVEIVECRPMSRTKRWRLVRVIKQGTGDLGPLTAEMPAENTPAS